MLYCPYCNQYVKEYYSATQQRCRECYLKYQRQYYQNHKRKEYFKKYHKQHADTKRAAAQAWSKVNRARINENRKKWRQNNPEKIKAYKKKYRHKINVRQQTLRKLNGLRGGLICSRCGGPFEEFHHTTYDPQRPLAGLFLCRACHGEEHASQRRCDSGTQCPELVQEKRANFS